MAYKKAKTFPRRSKTAFRRRSTTSKKWKSTSLDKVVERKVKRELSRVKRGPPRSVSVQLKPARFDRSTEVPDVMEMKQWNGYIQGPNSARKYAILPLSELVPPQRPATGEADDRFRSYDRVLIKGVCLRMRISHAEGCRLLVFAFRNGMRRDNPVSTMTRPHVDVAAVSAAPSKGSPPCELYYDVMTKEELMGIGSEYAIRNLGVHDGPFAVKRCDDGNETPRFDWKATDGTAFTARLNPVEGRPVGKITARIDGSVSKAHGKVFNAMFSSPSLMRTFGYDGQNPNVSGWVSSRSRQVELFIRLNEPERFAVPGGSSSVNECPLEVFVGFDCPGSLGAANGGKPDIVSGAIIASDMEVYYV